MKILITLCYFGTYLLTHLDLDLRVVGLGSVRVVFRLRFLGDLLFDLMDPPDPTDPPDPPYKV
jgi:hypothetical protein